MKRYIEWVEPLVSSAELEKAKKSVDEILNTLESIVSNTIEPLIPNANYVTIGVDRDDAAKVLEKILEKDKNKKAYEKLKVQS